MNFSPSKIFLQALIQPLGFKYHLSIYSSLPNSDPSLSSKLQPQTRHGQNRTPDSCHIPSPFPQLLLSKMAPASTQLLKPRAEGRPWFLSFSHSPTSNSSASPIDLNFEVCHIFCHVSISFAYHPSPSWHKAAINICVQDSRMDIDIRYKNTHKYSRGIAF